jgi:hypothetical protein
LKDLDKQALGTTHAEYLSTHTNHQIIERHLFQYISRGLEPNPTYTREGIRLPSIVKSKKLKGPPTVV